MRLQRQRFGSHERALWEAVEVDPDEIIVLIGSLAVSCVAGFKWYDRLTSAAPPYCAATPGVRWTLALLPLVLLLALGYCAGTEQPSRLQSRGVLRVLLVIDAANMLSSAGQPEADLAHTLLRWQEAGIHIESCRVDDTLELRSSPDRITVERPRWFRALWHNALSVFGLTKNPLGGFGGELPIPSGSSGGAGG